MNVSSKSQQGAALMVVLVMLVVVLILGVSSFQNSRLEESMAGNQRAASLAMMAAEYGASDFWYAVKGASVPVAGPDADDTAESYTQTILEALTNWVDTQTDVGVGVCNQTGEDLSNTCYVLSVGAPVGDLVPVTIDGLVFSGDLHGDSVSSAMLSDLSDGIVARRRIGMKWGVVIGESLSAINLVGNIADYAGINSQGEISGEEVDGYVNPAISVPTYDDALKVVNDILKDKLDGKAVFVPEDPGDPTGNGVWHATDVVNEDGDYTGDYSSCDTANNNLCNYKGGVAAQLGSPILTKPEEYHNFLESLLTQDAMVEGEDRATNWTPDISQDFGAGVHFVTERVDESQLYEESQGMAYDPVVYDPNNLNEDGTLSRTTFEVGNGNFSGSGVLVVDGNVEFSGNPEFDGLIIVLGDYSIKGSGGEPFSGSIISSPYSEHYKDSEGNTVIPKFDENGFLGFYTPEGDGPLTDSNGNEIAFEDITPEKQFDLVNVDVSGGGSQDYTYNYQSLLDAFSYFNGETLLALLVGQAKPDGTYDYGLSSWKEEVVVY